MPVGSSSSITVTLSIMALELSPWNSPLKPVAGRGESEEDGSSNQGREDLESRLGMVAKVSVCLGGRGFPEDKAVEVARDVEVEDSTRKVVELGGSVHEDVRMGGPAGRWDKWEWAV